MGALGEPIFELNPESHYYKVLKEVRDANGRVNEILDEIAEKYGFDSSEFKWYGAYKFGFSKYSVGYDKFKDQLTKHPDRNGVHSFKKSSSEYKDISSTMSEIDKIRGKLNPFTLHDIFGINNLKATHWVGDRYFAQVKEEEATKRAVEDRKVSDNPEPVKDADYREYLKLVLEQVEEKEGN